MECASSIEKMVTEHDLSYFVLEFFFHGTHMILLDKIPLCRALFYVIDWFWIFYLQWYIIILLSIFLYGRCDVWLLNLNFCLKLLIHTQIFGFRSQPIYCYRCHSEGIYKYICITIINNFFFDMKVSSFFVFNKVDKFSKKILYYLYIVSTYEKTCFCRLQQVKCRKINIFSFSDGQAALVKNIDCELLYLWRKWWRRSIIHITM